MVVSVGVVVMVVSVGAVVMVVSVGTVVMVVSVGARVRPAASIRRRRILCGLLRVQFVFIHTCDPLSVGYLYNILHYN